MRAAHDGSGFTLHYFQLMLGSQYFQEVMANSLNFAITVTAACTVIAYPLALLMSRYALPCKSVLHALLLLPLILPPFVGVLGVRQIFGYLGTINATLIQMGLIAEPIRWLGKSQYVGVIILQVVHLVPILYLSISASLKNSQRSLEEAAAVCGASPWRVLTTITLPLSFPGWFAGSVMVFIASFTDLGTPLLFEYRHVIPVQIFNMLSDANENRVGYSFVVFTCVVCIALFYLARAASGRAGYSSGGRIHGSASATTLSRFTTAITLVIITSYIAITLLPHLGVFLLSISGRWFMTALPDEITFKYYIELFKHPLTLQSMRNSVVLSVIATGLTVVVGFVIALRVARAESPSEKRYGALLETLSLLPLVVPGIVFAFGYVGAFAGTWLDSRMNPFPLLVAAYLVRRSPYMVRSVSAGMSEVSKAMEDAGATLGATPFQVARLITIPLIRRHIIAGGLLTFVYCVLEVSDGLLLALEEKFYPVSKAMYALMARPDGVELASALGVVVMVCMGCAFFMAEYLLTPRTHPPTKDRMLEPLPPTPKPPHLSRATCDKGSRVRLVGGNH